MAKGLTKDELIARLTSNSRPDGTGCLIWTAAISGGYGSMWVGDRVRKAHRVAFEAANGAIPAGMYVCHRCDKPACVEPAHLFLGTQRDNMADMCAKGRSVKQQGAKNHNAALNEEAVVTIRADSRDAASMAAVYGVTPHTIRAIRRGRLWGHLGSSHG